MRGSRGCFEHLGLTCTKHTYRICTDSFCKLHKMLHGYNPTLKCRKLGKVVNGAISTVAKLSIAFYLFTGRDKVNIELDYGVHANEPHRAMQEIVDLVNSCDELKFNFPPMQLILEIALDA